MPASQTSRDKSTIPMATTSPNRTPNSVNSCSHSTKTFATTSLRTANYDALCSMPRAPTSNANEKRNYLPTLPIADHQHSVSAGGGVELVVIGQQFLVGMLWVHSPSSGVRRHRSCRERVRHSPASANDRLG